MDIESIEPESIINKLNRDYQVEAIFKMINYYKYYKDRYYKKTGLVAMPTGSGKTAIIAVLARCIKEIGCVLVISPRIAISNQIEKELSGNFFKNKLQMNEDIPKQVYYYKDSLDSLNITNFEKSVIVATTQKIDYIRKNNVDQYETLIESTQLVIFDEGHYEPADSWSHTIRKFNCPRIIFTATPFRNDFKCFDIDWSEEYRVNICYNQLIQKESNYLRKVKVKDIRKRFTLLEFVDDILIRFDKVLLETPKAKLIIKCDNKDSIESISRILLKKKRYFIAIHESFSKPYKQGMNSEISKYVTKKVPEHPEKMDENIWIHQYKLLEGIDDPSFQVLAIYEPMRNVRALIQQIGRVIRNPEKNQKLALVYNYSGVDYKEEWDKFVKLDQNGHIINGFSRSIFDLIDNNLPELVYINGKFREKLNLTDEFEKWSEQEILSQIKVPLKINLLIKHKAFNFEYFIKNELEERFREKDKITYRNPAGKNSILFLYFTIRNSLFLDKKYFPEIIHDLCFIKEYKDHIAFLDTSDYLPIGKHNIGIGNCYNPQKLKSLFAKDSNPILSRITLNNSNFSMKEIRSHSFYAPSIKESTPFLNDFSHYVKSVFGTYQGIKPFKNYKNESRKDEEYQIKTYLGLSTGRISQNEPMNLSFQEFKSWLDYIENSIHVNKEYEPTFDRYATEQLNVIDPFPCNILLDLIELDTELHFKVDEEDVFLTDAIEDKCLNIVEENGKYNFMLQVNDYHFCIEIRFDFKNSKYYLDDPETELKIKGTENPYLQKTQSLIGLLNRKQSFRILTKSHYVYSNGFFYKPAVKIGQEFNKKFSQLEKILIPLKCLSKIGSEKGKRSESNNTKWQNDTLFNLIDSLGKDTDFKKYFDGTEMLLCDDLGTEIADFILFKNNKLILIHVKGIGNIIKSSAKHYSASAISEVCNQTIKNISYISMFSTELPTDRLKKWSSPWTIKNKRYDIDATINNRIRFDRKNLGVDGIWDDFLRLKYDPNIEKEVWIVLGKVFTKDIFIEKISTDVVPEAVQCAITLQSTLANVGSMGGRLKVFCSNNKEDIG